MNFLERAQILVDIGFPVIPVLPRKKRAFKDGWQNLATTDPGVLRQWNDENPEYNTGAVAKLEIGLILDLDSPEIVAKMKADGINLDQIRTFRVRGGKLAPCGHLYFMQSSASRTLGNFDQRVWDRATSKQVGTTFELRSNNGYVVGPGSRHPDGPEYTVVDSTPPIVIPVELVEWIKRQPRKIWIGETPQAEVDAEIAGGTGSARPRPGTLSERVPEILERCEEQGYDVIKAILAEYDYNHRHEFDLALAQFLFQQLKLHQDKGEAYDRSTLAKALKLSGSNRTLENNDTIRIFDAVPDIMTMEIPAIDYLVDGMIARKTITLWTGSDGTAKTFLLQKLAIAVATGGRFLGRCCTAAPVLYLDYENPSFAVRKRLDVMAGRSIANLKFWGTWVEQQPPQIGDETLLSIAQETKPLIIIDPFRYAHSAEENDSTEMKAVMQMLRFCATGGSAVIILHHPAKTDGSTGRGSSVIKGAADVAFLQDLSEETGLISLRCTKNRFGDRMRVTIQANYDDGTFEPTESEQAIRRASETGKLFEILTANPGLSQNAWWGESRMMKQRFVDLVKANVGLLWREEKSGNSLRYFPICSQNREQIRTDRTGQQGANCSSVLSPLGENREQVALDPPKPSVLERNITQNNVKKNGSAPSKVSSGKVKL